MSADPARIHDVRCEFEAWFSGQVSAGAAATQEIAVALSELLANAVAASPGPDSTVTVQAQLSQEELVLEVSNAIVPWVDGAIRWDLSDPLRTGGRGLLIIRALMDEIDVVQDLVEDLTTVRCRRALPEKRPAP